MVRADLLLGQLTGGKVASRCAVCPGAVYGWKAGRYRPPWEHFRAIAALRLMSVDELLVLTVGEVVSEQDDQLDADENQSVKDQGRIAFLEREVERLTAALDEKDKEE